MNILRINWYHMDKFILNNFVVAKCTNYVMICGDRWWRSSRSEKTKICVCAPHREGGLSSFCKFLPRPSASSPGVWGLYQKPSSKSSLSSSRSSSLSRIMVNYALSCYCSCLIFSLCFFNAFSKLYFGPVGTFVVKYFPKFSVRLVRGESFLNWHKAVPRST